jgi:hypothetical protein
MISVCEDNNYIPISFFSSLDKAKEELRCTLGISDLPKLNINKRLGTTKPLLSECGRYYKIRVAQVDKKSYDLS